MLKEKTRVQLENHYCRILINFGFNFASGVPCGVQKYIIKNVSQNSKIIHIPGVRESESIGIAAGAYLAGKKPLIYMQNSGLLNSINDITSLLIPYKIPILFSVSWRGAPGEDAPQHFIAGKSTKKILSSIGIPFHVLTKNNMESTVFICERWMKNKKLPAVILITRQSLR